MVWERAQIIASLTGKGFELERDGDHDVLTFKATGLTRAIFTKLSRGKKYRVYGRPLLSDMSHQLKLTRRQLDALVECPMQQPEYESVLRAQGLLREPAAPS